MSDDDDESMADAIINGEFCQVCGEYIGEGLGYPRTCDNCKEDEDVDK